MNKFIVKINERNIPVETLLKDLREVATQLCQDTVTTYQYNEFGKYNSSTYIRKFGSWFNALEQANLKKSRTPMNLSNEELLNNVKDVWMKLGRQPKYTEMKTPLSLYSAGTYDRRFGGWNNTLKEFAVWINADEQDSETYDSTFPTTMPEILTGFVHKTKREISDRMRFRVLMRDGFTCQSCGASPIKSRDVELHVDHITPWSKGGETIIENLQAKCSKCNLGKGNAFSE
jgi:hypothetical protein